MAAAGAVLEKTAHMYMQLIVDVEKIGVSVCSCVFEVRGGGKEMWQVLEHNQFQLISARLLWPLKRKYGSGRLK